MTSQFNSNDGHLSRLRMPPQSRIPKPKAAASSYMLSSFHVHLDTTELSSESCTPATANNSIENLDLLLDSSLKAQMATADEERSWLIGADRGSDVDELLDQFLEFEDCVDDEGSLPSCYVPSDTEESQGSHADPLEDTCSTIGEDEEVQDKMSQNNGYLQAFVGSMAKTLRWLAQTFRPATPLDRSNVDRNAYSSSNDRNTRSGAASSCKSSRSLSAAFDLAALEPEVFQFASAVEVAAGGQQCLLEPELSSSNYNVSRSIASQLHCHYENHQVEDEDDDEDDFLSACSEICEGTITSRPATAAASPGQLSISSESSGADSEEMHLSLLKTSLGVGAVSDWLSNG